VQKGAGRSGSPQSLKEVKNLRGIGGHDNLFGNHEWTKGG